MFIIQCEYLLPFTPNRKVQQIDLNRSAFSLPTILRNSDVSLTYEEQIEESKRRAPYLRNLRIPKFFKLLQLTISSNPSKSGFLIGDRITTADLTLFQVLEGIKFAFPKLWESLKKSNKYDGIFQLREQVSKNDGIDKYLKSGRRKEFSDGLFRHYPELDGELED